MTDRSVSTPGTPLAALIVLVNRLREIHADEKYKSVWAINQIHTGPYTGPTYTAELDAAMEAIACASSEIAPNLPSDGPGLLATAKDMAPVSATNANFKDWTLVPNEPTPEMVDALNNMAVCAGYIEKGYRAMLKAAPKPTLYDEWVNMNEVLRK